MCRVLVAVEDLRLLRWIEVAVRGLSLISDLFLCLLILLIAFLLVLLLGLLSHLFLLLHSVASLVWHTIFLNVLFIGNLLLCPLDENLLDIALDLRC